MPDLLDDRPISDLERFCLAIAAQIEGEPCPKCLGHYASLRITFLPACVDCHGSGKAPPEVCESREGGETCGECNGIGMEKTAKSFDAFTLTPVLEHCKVCQGFGKTSTRTVYTSPYVVYAADWLEQHGDPGERFVKLRGYQVEDIGSDEYALILHLGPRSDQNEVLFIGDLADAIRELMRHGLDLLTVECFDCGVTEWKKKHPGIWPGDWSCACKGRGWMPAWTQWCHHSRLHHSDLPDSDCPDCHGRKWVKVPSRKYLQSPTPGA